MQQAKPIKVLMVCLGNICRSPTAEGVLRAKLKHAGLAERVVVDSAGTSNWHVGESPDPRTVAAAFQRHYDLRELRGRQVSDSDFEDFDYILAMDTQNLRDLIRRCPEQYRVKLSLFLKQGTSTYLEVPDPYDHGADVFELVLDLVEEASLGLIGMLGEKHALSAES